jgi:hypothetical protein
VKNVRRRDLSSSTAERQALSPVLAACALALFPPGRLERELDGVDVGAELRRYYFGLLILLVPFLMAAVLMACDLPRIGRR